MATRSAWMLAAALVGCAANGAGLTYLLLREPEAPPSRRDSSGRGARGPSSSQVAELARALQKSSARPVLPDPASAEAAEAKTTDEGPASDPQSQPPPVSVEKLVADVFGHEVRDAAWAGEVEQRFRARMQQSGHHDGVSVERLECGSTRCGVVLTTRDSESFSHVGHWFGPGKFAYAAKPTENGYKYHGIFVRDGHDANGNEVPL